MRDVLMQFRIAFRTISRHYHRVRAHLGVNGAQLWALAEVGANPGVTIGELARRLAIHQSTASNLVETLESDGFVQRRRDEADRRLVRVHPSARGNRVLKRAPQPLRGVLQQALSDMPVASLRALHRELAILLTEMHVDDRRTWQPTLAQQLDEQERRK